MLTIDSLGYRTQQKTLLHPLSATFYPGKIYGLIGPNGSGKTTFLKTLARILFPSSGRVLWNSLPIEMLCRLELARTISLSMQSPLLTFDYTVEDIVAMGAYPRGLSSKATQEAVAAALEKVGASDLRTRSILKISQGEKQRVFMARSLATDAPVLLLDEPTANLDIRHREDIWQLIRLLAGQNKIVVVANHDLSGIERYCDHILALHEGMLVNSGTPQDVLSPQALLQLFKTGNVGFSCKRLNDAL